MLAWWGWADRPKMGVWMLATWVVLPMPAILRARRFVVVSEGEPIRRVAFRLPWSMSPRSVVSASTRVRGRRLAFDCRGEGRRCAAGLRPSVSARALVLAVVGGWLACVLAFGVSAAVADSVGQITEFSVPTAASQPFSIAAGADGNLWFTEQTANNIGRITPTGQITEFRVPPADGFPSGVAAGPDGNLWFTANAGDRIGQITPAGQITDFSIPTTDSDPLGIAAGLDGNLWFTEDDGDKIGRITPAGQITEFSIPTAGGFPSGIATGTDGNVWFTENGEDKIGKITPAGQITEFAVPTAGSVPAGIAAGPDGDLWFTEFGGDKIGKITPAGQITEFAVPTAGGEPFGIAAGADGNLWFTEYAGDKIGRITPAGQITEISIPTPGSVPAGIAAGPDGNLWFTELKDKIGRVDSGAAAALRKAPSVTGSARQGTQQVCQGELWADWSGQQPVQNASTGKPAGVQWLLNGTPIAGATSQTYTPTSGDVGKQLACTVAVTYPLLHVTESATSAGVEVLAPMLIGPAAQKPGKPTASDVLLLRIATANPQIAFTLTAGAHAHPIKSIVVELPRGISFTHKLKRLDGGIIVNRPHAKRLKFTAKISDRELTTTLASTATALRVRIASPAITVSRRLVHNIRHARVKKLSFLVKVTDSANTTTKLTLENVKV